MNLLRHVSIFISEPDPGLFFWVLHEEADEAGQWRDIEASEQSFSTWASAWEHGVIALQRLVGDPIRGPCAPREDAAPVG